MDILVSGIKIYLDVISRVNLLCKTQSNIRASFYIKDTIPLLEMFGVLVIGVVQFKS